MIEGASVGLVIRRLLLLTWGRRLGFSFPVIPLPASCAAGSRSSSERTEETRFSFSVIFSQ